MKFSEAWLREWVNPDIDTTELVEQLTLLGLEVDDHSPAGGSFTDVVVAEIVEAAQHPDADRLRVCQVDDGSGERFEVVCGAPNARQGLRVPFARVGAKLPGGLKIRASKLRGVKSHGMLCSAAELQLAEEADGLHELPADAPLGVELADYLSLADQVIEIELTPNRGDCFCIRGVAREIGARNGAALQSPDFSPVAPVHDDRFGLQIDADSCCANYAGRVIRGIDTSAVTPLWMVEKLRRSGIRSISPAVDVTNYVMLSIGQPMHAFDLSKLEGGIHVRLAAQGEKIVLLDGREIELDSDTTVIADHNRAVAIAGIMGGDSTGVDADTNDILLEAALFVPLGIAAKPRRYNAYTDSAQRFERGVDSELQASAMEYATRLLLDIVGGEAGPVFEVRNEALNRELPVVDLARERLDRYLGTHVADDRVASILDRLGMSVEQTGSGWRATSPSWRYDIAIEEDLIEEVARVYGFNNIPRTNPDWAPQMADAPEISLPRHSVHQLLINRGYQEAVCYSFVDNDVQQLFEPELAALPLSNPIASDMGVMRNTLWVGLCEAMKNNQNRQQSDIRFFEVGLKFVPQGDDLIQKPVLAGLVAANRLSEHWDGEAPKADFFDVKGDVEALLQLASAASFTFETGAHAALHPGRCARIMAEDQAVGWLGELHPRLQKILDLSQLPVLFELDLQALDTVRLPAFADISKFPAVRRDLAIIVDAEISAAEIGACARRHGPTTLQDVRIFDIYTGKGIASGRKSVALGLILQDISSTLGDVDIDTATSRILNGLASDLRATLRT